jgi:hypothetical protein
MCQMIVVSFRMTAISATVASRRRLMRLNHSRRRVDGLGDSAQSLIALSAVAAAIHHVQRHLHRVKMKAMLLGDLQHIEVRPRIFVPSKTDEVEFARLTRFEQGHLGAKRGYEYQATDITVEKELHAYKHKIANCLLWIEHSRNPSWEPEFKPMRPKHLQLPFPSQNGEPARNGKSNGRAIENPDAYYERIRDMARFGCEFNATDDESHGQS